jgi:hypothetical protein
MNEVEVGINKNLPNVREDPETPNIPEIGSIEPGPEEHSDNQIEVVSETLNEELNADLPQVEEAQHLIKELSNNPKTTQIEIRPEEYIKDDQIEVRGETKDEESVLEDIDLPHVKEVQLQAKQTASQEKELPLRE